MKMNLKFIAMACLAFVLAGCEKKQQEPEVPEDPAKEANIAINYSLKSLFGTYYYWIDELNNRLNAWGDADDPKLSYQNFKHKNDRWGFVADNYEEISQAFQNVSTSYGLDGVFARLSGTDTLCYFIRYVAPDSPAQKAGLKRGDCFSKFNDKAVLCKSGDDDATVKKKLNELVEMMYAGTTKFSYFYIGGSVTMTPIEKFQENTVNLAKVFDFDGKKVAYLHYTSFGLNEIPELVKTFASFKAEGASELILDLRYNGGGYIITEELMADMIAPVSVVKSELLFSVLKYNRLLTASVGMVERTFSPSLTVNVTGNPTNGTYNVIDSNPDFEKVYVIYTDDSASASELLVNGLLPYVDIEIFGQNSYGKNATCNLISTKEWYVSVKDELSPSQYKNGIKYASDWCAYVTLGLNVNAKGECKCSPDGFQIDSDKIVNDAFYEPYQIGDPQELMLNKVLTYAGYVSATKALPSEKCIASGVVPVISEREIRRPVSGAAIETRVLR